MRGSVPFWGEVGVTYTQGMGRRKAKSPPVLPLPKKFRWGVETERPLRPRPSQRGHPRAHGRITG